MTFNFFSFVFVGIPDSTSAMESDDNSGIEEAVEAAEELVFDPSQDQSEELEGEEEEEEDNVETKVEQVQSIQLQQYYLAMAIAPLVFILVVQILPLSNWVIGFITGIVICKLIHF